MFQGMLVRYLNESANRLTTSIIANHKMQLKAQSGLPSNISPPAWIGEPPRPWPAEEILACRNQLVHLPSLVGGCEHCLPGHATILYAGRLGLRFRFPCWAAGALVERSWANCGPMTRRALPRCKSGLATASRSIRGSRRSL